MAVARLVRSVFFLAGAIGLGALVGCGPSAAAVSGVITYNGQPPKFKGVQISFIGADGRMASAPVAEDGAYKADGVPVGDVGVGFVYTSPVQAQPPKAGPKMPKPGGGAPSQMPAQPSGQNPIPMQLRDASTSKLTCKVEGGKKNTFDYDIKQP